MNSFLNIIFLLFALTGSSAIYQGYKAVKNQFPFLASLRGLNNGTFKHNCGASIISNRFLLTAAHCHDLDNIDDYRVSIGAHTREDGDLYYVKEIFEYPDFDIIKRKHDIALILLNDTIQFSVNVDKILVDYDFIEGEKLAITAGWGRNEV